MANQFRVGIIGTGWVGSSVAISTLQAGVAGRVLLADAREDVAEGEAMDLAHGSSFYPAADVRSVPLEALLETDAVVIAAGRGSRPAESRLDLLLDNAKTIRAIASSFRHYNGVVIVVTNPVDVLTFEFGRASGLAPSHVIGTGTMLDTARLHQIVGRTLRIAPQSIHAHVIGEHGDSEVVLWSSARAAGVPLRSWTAWTAQIERGIGEEVRRAAAEIIRRKGATNHAIGLVTASMLRVIARDERRILAVSRAQDGALGYRDVAFSLPTIVGRDGASTVIVPPLADDEGERLGLSVAVLKQALASMSV